MEKPKRRKKQPRDGLDHDVPPTQVGATFERDAGQGISTKPEDHIWIGEQGKLTPYEWIDLDLGYRGSLEVILLAIIRSNSVTGLSEETRLRSAVKALIGKRKVGRPRGDWPVLLAIGKEWFSDYVGHEERSHADYVRAGASAAGKNIDDLADESDFIKRTWRKFENDKDAVLMEVTGKSTTEQGWRQGRIARVLGDLNFLGIIPDADKKGANAGGSPPRR